MSPATPVSTPVSTLAISAILCTYNRAELLRQALQGLATQTLPADRCLPVGWLRCRQLARKTPECCDRQLG